MAQQLFNLSYKIDKMRNCKCKNVKYKRICEESTVHGCEVSKFDLEILTVPTDISIEFQYRLINTGTNTICGKVLIYSKIFGKLLFDKVMILEGESTTVSKTYDDVEITVNESARAYIKISESFWIYSNKVKIQASYLGPLLSAEIYPVFNVLPVYSQLLIFSNDSLNYIDSRETKGIVSFGDSVDVQKFQLFNEAGTVRLYNFTIEDNRVIIDIGTIVGNSSVSYLFRVPDLDPVFPVNSTMNAYVTASNFDNNNSLGYSQTKIIIY